MDMVAQPHDARMSVEDYLALDRNSNETRYEFIDGHAYMLAGGTANHSIICANLIRELGLALRGGPYRVYTSDMRVRLSEKRYVYPDVTVSCEPSNRGSVEALHYPHLVVEVLSPSTGAYDRGKKFSYYRACPTLEEYVLIDTQEQAIEIYLREQNAFWRIYPFGQGDQVKLRSLKVHFPIDAIYEDIVLPQEEAGDKAE